jgi:hypothetical protein
VVDVLIVGDDMLVSSETERKLADLGVRVVRTAPPLLPVIELPVIELGQIELPPPPPPWQNPQPWLRKKKGRS